MVCPDLVPIRHSKASLSLSLSLLHIFLGEYPKGCNENVNNPCISSLIGWIYSGIPLLGSLLFLILSNLAIYLKVRHTIAQSERFASRGSQQQRNVRQRDVGTQATLYVFAYFSCIGWMLAVRILESNGVSRDDEQSIYGILLLTGIFYPAQGFWYVIRQTGRQT